SAFVSRSPFASNGVTMAVVIDPKISVVIAAPWSCGVSSQGRDADVLHLRVGAEGVDALLPAVSAVLEPTEGKHGAVAGTEAVHVDLSRIDALGHPHTATQIARPDERAEAVLGAVGDAHGILLIVEGDHD